MTLARVKQIMESAEKRCSIQGARFTRKRKEIFEVMLREKKALSAYEIAERVKETNDVSVPVMSVYRILDFLQHRGLVHRIASVNRYAACAHITCGHKHEMPRLAVCLKCQSVDEIASNTSVKKSLQKGLKEIDFQLQNQQIELLGLCAKCSNDGI